MNTLQNVSDTGPSLSEDVNSFSTFSNPLLIACISSARIFSCICIDLKLFQPVCCQLQIYCITEGDK